MEFGFCLDSLFQRDITRSVGGALPHSGPRPREECEQQFSLIVDAMGIASAKAQGLRAPITTFQKLRSSNHILYVLVDRHNASNCKNGAVVGILKVGHKKLFLNDQLGNQHEVEPLCVLDFYVHESRQRSGCGKQLFEAMLQMEGVKPFEVAIDRPSPKFLGFLRKHYNLSTFVKQANNYVVFNQFFSTCTDISPCRPVLQSLSPHTSRRRSIGNISSEPPSHESVIPTAKWVKGPLSNDHSTIDTQQYHLTSPLAGRGGRERGTAPSSTASCYSDRDRDRENSAQFVSDVSKPVHPSSFNRSPDYYKQSQLARDKKHERYSYKASTVLQAPPRKLADYTQYSHPKVQQDTVTCMKRLSYDSPYTGSIPMHAQTGSHNHRLLQYVDPKSVDPSLDPVDSKAPFLNMRQQNRRMTTNKYGGSVSSGNSFYSATTAASQSTQGVKYSRHNTGNTGGGHLDSSSTVAGVRMGSSTWKENSTGTISTGLLGTSLVPYHSTRSRIKNTDKWKSV